MTDHFCRLTKAFHYGQGTRYTAHCPPCRWTSQSHKNAADANADYAKHSAPVASFIEPPEAELVQYGLNPSLLAKTAVVSDPFTQEGATP